MVEEKTIICGKCKRPLKEDYPVVWDGQLYHGKCYSRLKKE